MNALARFAHNRRAAAIVAIILGAIVFLCVNLVANSVFRTGRIDLTENSLFTLSDGTKNILRSLNEPVRIRFFYSASTATDYPTVKAYAERVRDLLAEYKAIAGDNLIVEEIDPEPYTAAEDTAVGLGLQGAPTQTGETIYLGLTANNLADGQEVIPFFAMDRETLLEYDLTSMISRLGPARKPRLGLMTNLPLDTGPGGLLASMQGQSQPYVIYSQLMQIFDLVTVPQDISVVPADIEALIVAHPKALSEPTLYALDQFVMRGGRIIAFVDPKSEITEMVNATGGDQMPGANTKSDLWLLKSWGVTYDPETVVLDAGRAQQVQYGTNAARPSVSYPVWLGLKKSDNPDESDFDANDLVTGSLNLLNLASVGALSPAEGATTSFQTLVRSSTNAMTIPAETLNVQTDPDELNSNFQPTNTHYTIAARLSGPLKSAFPDGAPKTAPAPGPTAAEPPVLPAHLGETANANIIVVADTDIFDDRFWVQVQNQGGQAMGVPIADNLSFVASAAENMLGSNDLISLRARATSHRPFTVVDNLRKDAEARFLREEQALNAKIAEVSEKLQALQRTAPNGGDVATLTPEQEAEVQKFQLELADTRSRLREVQRSLRADIDRLGNTLALVNVALIPLILIVVAVVIGMLRRRRVAAAQAH